MPIATYRLQLTPDFTFDHAAELCPYLARLGVSHLYLSPIFQARRDSTHGYDATDPNALRAELGGAEGFDRLSARARSHRLQILIDIVPNHMAADADNPWWWDVLGRGRASPHAAVFDIDWEANQGRIRIPTLGDPLEDVLARGELSLADRSGEAVLRYYESLFPLARGSAAELPATPTEADLRTLLDRQHYELCEWREGSRRLNYRRFFDINELIGVRVEDPEVFEKTHDLIFHLVAEDDVHALRIDHIDGLRNPAGYLRRLHQRLREVRPDRETPVLVEKILAPGEHLPPDWGDAGTTGYEFLNELNRLFVPLRAFAEIDRRTRARTGAPAFEEILERAKRDVLERLFAAELDALASRLAAIGAALGAPVEPAATYAAILELTAALDVYRTYTVGLTLSDHDRPRLDAAVARAREKAIEPDAAAAMDLLERVCYLRDRARLEAEPSLASEVEDFIARWQQLTGPAMAKGFEDTALYRHVVLTSLNEVGGEPGSLEPNPLSTFHEACIRRVREEPLSLTTTSTHDTKRGEDTRCRIDALAHTLGGTTGGAHAGAESGTGGGTGVSPVSTSPIPPAPPATSGGRGPAPDSDSSAPSYLELLDRWMDRHAALKGETEFGRSPPPTHEILAYQSIVGVWPAEMDELAALAERLCGYMQKAGREAKRRTSWRYPAEAHEQAVDDFINALLLEPAGAEFRGEVGELLRAVGPVGAAIGLGQLVLKMAAPGFPDIYQGCELWNLSLVDPDNRRPIDYSARSAMLERLASIEAGRLAEHARQCAQSWSSGEIKLLATHRLLSARAADPELFLAGDYIPLASDPQSPVMAFARSHEGRWALALAARSGLDRWPQGLGREASDSLIELPGGAPAAWRCAITARELPLSSPFRAAEAIDILPATLLLG